MIIAAETVFGIIIIIMMAMFCWFIYQIWYGEHLKCGCGKYITDDYSDTVCTDCYVAALIDNDNARVVYYLNEYREYAWKNGVTKADLNKWIELNVKSNGKEEADN